MNRFCAVNVAHTWILVILPIIFGLLGLQTCAVTAVSSQSANERSPYIAEVKAEYFKVSDALWHRIEQMPSPQTPDDTANMNETVYSVLNAHVNVLFGNTFETNSYWRSYLLFGIENFRDRLTAINDTLDAAQAHLYGADNRIIYDALNIEQWTHDSMLRRLTENMDVLFQQSVQHNNSVFQHIQNVSTMCAISSQRSGRS